jgi:hypothetical protein
MRRLRFGELVVVEVCSIHKVTFSRGRRKKDARMYTPSKQQ